MAIVKHPVPRLLFLAAVLAVLLMKDVTGARVPILLTHSHHHHHLQTDVPSPTNVKDGSKRLLIGSVAPTCTYNECRGCKYKCRAEQVPVEGNDPINSAYHYKCVCHR